MFKLLLSLIRCSFDAAKCGFYRIANSTCIFWQGWTSCLLFSKCVYADTNVWVRGLPSKQVRCSFSRLCVNIFEKMFKTNRSLIVRTCQEQFRFRLPCDLVASRSKKLEPGEFVQLYFSYKICRLFKLVKFIVSTYYAPAPRVVGLKRWYASDVCLTVTYIGSKSRSEKPRNLGRLKLAQR